MRAPSRSERRDSRNLSTAPCTALPSSLLAFTCEKERSICLKDLSTGGQRILTDGPHWNPRISHDGTRIAYTFNASGAMPLFVVPTSGGRAERLGDEGGWAFGWFYDNRRLLYRKSYTQEIHLVDVTTRRSSKYAA